MTQRRVEITLHTLAHFRLYRLTLTLADDLYEDKKPKYLIKKIESGLLHQNLTHQTYSFKKFVSTLTLADGLCESLATSTAYLSLLLAISFLQKMRNFRTLNLLKASLRIRSYLKLFKYK